MAPPPSGQSKPPIPEEKRRRKDFARFQRRVAKVDAQMDAKRGIKPASPELKGGLGVKPPRSEPSPQEGASIGALMADIFGPQRDRTPRLRSSALKGKPIVVGFPVPLDESQQAEVAKILRPLLSGKECRVRIEDSQVVVEGLLERESKAVRDLLVRFRNNVCPKPIRMRPPGG
jgi:hypothetical protein